MRLISAAADGPNDIGREDGRNRAVLDDVSPSLANVGAVTAVELLHTAFRCLDTSLTRLFFRH